MDIEQLNKQIADKCVDNFYIFVGEEIELQNIYVRKLAPYVRVDRVKDSWLSLTQKTLWTTDRTVVVRDDMEFIKDEKAWKYIEKKIVNGRLILLFTEPNLNTKFFKTYKDRIIEFKHTSARLISEVSKEFSGSQKAIKYFVDICKEDMKTVENEMDKLKRLGHEVITQEIVDEVVGVPIESNIFQLVDSIISKSEDTFEIAEELLDREGFTMHSFTALLQQRLHNCILVEGSVSNTNLPWATIRSIQKYNNMKPTELLKAIRIVNKYHQGHISGKYEDKDAIKCCIAEIMLG